MRRTASLAFVVSALLSACGKPSEPACGLNVTIALLLTIDDSLTAGPVLNAMVQVTEPSGQTQSATVGPDIVYPLMFGSEAGPYIVSITSPGYVAWLQTITVSGTNAFGCNPEAVPLHFTARLRRST
jgi:hypothetical protein